MSDDETVRPDESSDETVAESKKERTPEEIAAAERRFFAAREAWLNEQEEKRGQD
jgi:hypothetical protein